MATCETSGLFLQVFVPGAGAVWNNLPLQDGDELVSDESEKEAGERRRWQEWAKHATEHERQRRMKVDEQMRFSIGSLLLCGGMSYSSIFCQETFLFVAIAPSRRWCIVSVKRLLYT